jgi:hypothetical protein
MTFRCSWAAIVVLCGLTLLACAIASWPRLGLAAVVGAPFVTFEAVLLLRFKVRVNDDGVVLYGRHRLPWSDVLAAKRYSIPIFPYLVVRRPRGFAWWIPLYFQGERDLAQVLIDKSPPNSPIRLALSTAS